MKAIFMGTPEIAAVILKSVLNLDEVARPIRLAKKL